MKPKTQDVIDTLSKMACGFCDRFELGVEMAKQFDPMDAFAAIHEAVQSRKVRQRKFGKGQEARFMIELLK